MQACLETPALPLVQPASLPLVDADSLPLLQSVPAWSIRITRPADPNRHELAQELRGVPKSALRHVFGQALAARLWQKNRSTSSATSTNAKTAPAAAIPQPPSSLPEQGAPISDGEISSGMLRYLCAEAAATLREHKRVAKSISLTVSYSDGESETVREPLPQASNDATSLQTAARLALRNARSHAFVSLKLDLTATPAQA